MAVRNWMSPKPVTVHPSMDLPTAAHLMKQHRIRHLPVTTQGRVIGILSDRDLRSASMPQVDANSLWDIAYELSRTTVADRMVKPAVTIDIDTSLEEAVAMLLRHRIGCLPVLAADGTLAGVLTQTDVMRAAASMLRTARESQPVEVS